MTLGPCTCGHPASKHDNVRCLAKYGSSLDRCDCMGYRPKASHARRFPKGAAPAYLAWIRTLPCTVNANYCGGYPTEAAHVKSKGAGGADEGNTIPLCSWHHLEQHNEGIRTFATRHNLNLAAVASRLWTDYEALNGEPVL